MTIIPGGAKRNHIRDGIYARHALNILLHVTRHRAARSMAPFARQRRYTQPPGRSCSVPSHRLLSEPVYYDWTRSVAQTYSWRRGCMLKSLPFTMVNRNIMFVAQSQPVLAATRGILVSLSYTNRAMPYTNPVKLRYRIIGRDHPATFGSTVVECLPSPMGNGIATTQKIHTAKLTRRNVYLRPNRGEYPGPTDELPHH